MSAATTATSITALAGTLAPDSVDHSRDPGMAPSRLNAKVIREALVMHEVVQKNWPTAEMSRIVPAHLLSIAWVKM